MIIKFLLMKKNIVFLLIILNCFTSTSQSNALWTRYPSISPDGSQIAFSYRGNIFKVSSQGGKAIQLTAHVDHDMNPIWSNDGKQIAFASNRNGNFDIYTIPSSGGQSHRITYHSYNDQPSGFSPDNSHVLFTSLRQDPSKSALFPTPHLPELYSVPTEGGRIKQVLSTPAEKAVYTKDGEFILYQDKKGYEDPWRKHHTSSVTRDIWAYNTNTQKHTKISGWLGEDRNPIFHNNKVYFLSERESNDFNVWQCNMDGSDLKQITNRSKHPVRFLSMSNEGVLCYFFNGEIYTQPINGEAEKVSIQVQVEDNINNVVRKSITKDASEMVVSPNGKEIAFVVRGEIYVTSKEYVNTKRITDTPFQERNVQFSPDGKKLIYASERDNSWNIYETSIKNKDEKYFYSSTLLEEKEIVKNENETFQPAYSPNGKEVAYLSERTGINIINLESKVIRTVIEPHNNYSYTDGDQSFEWSPDGKWIAFPYIDNNRWMADVAMIKTDGKSKPINLTNSGYGEGSISWELEGNALMFTSDRHGRRAHASWGADRDIYMIYLNQETFDKYDLDEADFELKYGEKDKDKDKKDDEIEDDKSEEIKTINIDVTEEIGPDRIKRLTRNSSSISGQVLSKDGQTLYFLSKFEKGYDLWSHHLVKKETKLVQKLSGGAYGLALSKDGTCLFVLDGGSIKALNIKGDRIEMKPVSFKSTMNYDAYGERKYMFEHAWKQVNEKFYVKDLQGVNWPMYKEAYSKFLPHINNGFDFAELLSEMLGELNASHTGGRYWNQTETMDETASLGLLYDFNYDKTGLKVDHILKHGPFDNADSKIDIGSIILSVNGKGFSSSKNQFKMLNNLKGQPTSIKFKDSKGKEHTETIKPIGFRDELGLLYDKWVEDKERFTETYSKGKIAYVHVKGMNESSYRTVYNELLGKYHDYDAVVVDTRFNGGGWLHDDLATLLSGKLYMTFSPRGQENMGGEPIFKWKQPSIVLMGEGNYSDAHMFPYTYRALGIGKLVGMPVPGTGTAVWWERQIDGQTVFGIPQVGMKGTDGKYLENQDLNPDIKVELDVHTVSSGDDKQLKQAIDELMITGSRDH